MQLLRPHPDLLSQKLGLVLHNLCLNKPYRWGRLKFETISLRTPTLIAITYLVCLPTLGQRNQLQSLPMSPADAHTVGETWSCQMIELSSHLCMAQHTCGAQNLARPQPVEEEAFLSAPPQPCIWIMRHKLYCGFPLTLYFTSCQSLKRLCFAKTKRKK